MEEEARVIEERMWDEQMIVVVWSLFAALQWSNCVVLHNNNKELIYLFSINSSAVALSGLVSDPSATFITYTAHIKRCMSVEQAADRFSAACWDRSDHRA